jgi:hypothetical protein
MDERHLPGEGPVRLGPVTLPSGRLITIYGRKDPVAWVTVDPVPKSSQAWTDLSALHAETGMIPIQVGGNVNSTRRPLDLLQPEDPREADSIDVGTLLGDLWRDWVSWPAEDDPDEPERRRPFTKEFPGLAAPEHVILTQGERQQALSVILPRIRQAHAETPEAHIGLVVAARPADVLAVIGWGGLANRGESLLPLTAVLRSWEDRFGARLIDVGFADLRLLVERPPRTLEAAQYVAAEHVVLADECVDGLRDLPHTAARLVDNPIWTFWWD